jgi:hypothetical protein
MRCYDRRRRSSSIFVRCSSKLANGCSNIERINNSCATFCSRSEQQRQTSAAVQQRKQQRRVVAPLCEHGTDLLRRPFAFIASSSSLHSSHPHPHRCNSPLVRIASAVQSLILAESASGWSTNSTAIITAVYHICILSRVATLLRSVRFSMRACDAQRFFSRTLFSFPHPGPLGFSFACCCLFLVEQVGRGAGNVPR